MARRIVIASLIVMLGAVAIVYDLLAGDRRTWSGSLALVGGLLMAGGVLAILVVFALSSRAGSGEDRPDADTQLPSLSRTRRRFLGARTAETDRLTAVLATGGRGGVGVGRLLPPPGPFDNPPQEDIVLDPDATPWELRDDPEHPTRDLPLTPTRCPLDRPSP